jgi:hypothetical protein
VIVKELIDKLKNVPQDWPVVCDVNGKPNEIHEVQQLNLTYSRPFGNKFMNRAYSSQVFHTLHTPYYQYFLYCMRS